MEEVLRHAVSLTEESGTWCGVDRATHRTTESWENVNCKDCLKKMP